jgi:acyl-CoA thioester hydrolase
MTGSIETYRGVVAAWECDVFAHLTIAYYFDRIADASAALRHRLGGGRTTGLVVRYLKELRAGDALHVESGVIGRTGDALLVGHKVLNSGTGELTTSVEETLAGTASPAVDTLTMLWEEPAGPDPAAAASSTGFVAAGRDAVKPFELNAEGTLALPAYVHRFSAACLQAVTRFGMTPVYMREARRGFSTFETRLRLDEPAPRAGDLLYVETAIRQIGSSSIRLLHVMRDARSDAPVATFHQAGVHFDMDARRSAPWPDALRDAGRAMVGG